MGDSLHRDHAVVIGGGIAGLLAAEVLSRHFSEVTLLERDPGFDYVAPRKGVPQGHHAHVLLAAGMQALDRLLPALRSNAVAHGAIEYDIGHVGTVHLGQTRLHPVQMDTHSLLLSRPLLERCIRDQVRTHGRVKFRSGVVVRGLIGDSVRTRGVRVATAGEAEADDLHADLVVDCSGKGSKLPAWLLELGLPPAPEELVRANVRYSTCMIRRRPEHLGGQLGWAVAPAPPLLRFGGAQAIEGDRYMITIISYLGTPGAASFEAVRACARELPYPGLAELLHDAEPLSDVVQMTHPVSRRRRYERLARFPQGLLAMGDAACNFNPAYGQGMTVAALEAEALGQCLAQGDRALFTRFYRRCARIIDPSWELATGGDLQWPGVEGRRPFGASLLSPYFARMIQAAEHTPLITKRLIEVLHLLAPPQALLSLPVIASMMKPATRPRSAAPEASAFSRTVRR